MAIYMKVDYAYTAGVFSQDIPCEPHMKQCTQRPFNLLQANDFPISTGVSCAPSMYEQNK